MTEQIKQSKFKWVIGVLFLPAGGFFLLPPINKFINEVFINFNYFGVEQLSKINRLIIEKTNDWARFFIAFIVLLSMMFSSPEFQSSYNSENNTAGAPAQSEAKIEEPTVLKATPQAIENMKAFLNSGYELVDESKVYYTKSKDYKNVYFFGTLVIKNGQVEPCIWTTNLPEFNNIMSVNEGALNATPVPDARKSEAKISSFDDGYTRINTKILSDMNNAIN